MGNNNSIKIDEKTSFEHDGEQFRLSLNKNNYILMKCSKDTKESILKFIKKIQNDASLTKMLQKLKSLDSEKLNPSYSNYDAFNDKKRKEVIDLSLKLLENLFREGDKFRKYKEIVYMELIKFSEVRRGEHYTSPTSIAYEIVIEYLEKRYGSLTSENKKLVKEIMEQTKPKNKQKKKTKMKTKKKTKNISMRQIIVFGALVLSALNSNFLSTTQNSMQSLTSPGTVEGSPANNNVDVSVSSLTEQEPFDWEKTVDLKKKSSIWKFTSPVHSEQPEMETNKEPVANVNKANAKSLLDLTTYTGQNSTQNLSGTVTFGFDSLPVNFLKRSTDVGKTIEETQKETPIQNLIEKKLNENASDDINEVEQVTNDVVDTPWSTVSSPDVGNWNRSSVWKTIETQKELKERNKTQAAVQQQIQNLIEEELKENIIEDEIIEELGNDMQLQQVYDETKELTSKLTKQLKEKLQNKYAEFQKEEIEKQNALIKDPSKKDLVSFNVEASKRWYKLIETNQKLLKETKESHDNAVMNMIVQKKQELTGETNNDFQKKVIDLQSQLLLPAPASSLDQNFKQVKFQELESMGKMLNQVSVFDKSLENLSTTKIVSFSSFDKKLSNITDEMTKQLVIYEDTWIKLKELENVSNDSNDSLGKEMVVYNENVLSNRKEMVKVVEEHMKDAVKETRQQYTVSVILDQVKTPDNIPTMETTTNVEPPSTVSVQDKDDKVKALYDKTLGSTEELNTLVAVKDIMQCNIQEYEPALFMDTVGEPQTQFQWDPLIGNCDQDVCMSTRQLYWVNGDSLQKHALCKFKKIVSSSNEALVLISDEKSPFETAAPMRFNLTEKHAMEVLDNGWYKFSSKETNAVVLVSPDDVEFYNLQGEQSILTPLHQLEKIDQQKFTSQLSKIDKDKENKELEVLHASFVKIKEKVVYCMKLSGTLLLMKNVNEYGLLGFPLPPPSPFPSGDTTGTLSLVVGV